MNLNGRMGLILGLCAMLVAVGGLVMGKHKEKQYMEAMQSHRDFTLLDDKDDLFQLNGFPKEKKLLLIFTPDGIPTSTVKPFFDFSRHLRDFAKRGIEVKLVSRMNKEIVLNFKAAAHFEGRVLFDAGGPVGRAAGAWPTLNPESHWTYVLVDNQFNVYWSKQSAAPLAYRDIPLSF